MALLDVDHEPKGTPGREDDGGGSGGSSKKIRMFGVFDGHGGEKRALAATAFLRKVQAESSSTGAI